MLVYQFDLSMELVTIEKGANPKRRNLKYDLVKAIFGEVENE